LWCWCDRRHATWNGRLSDDAFAEDMVDNLLSLHVERQLNKALTPALNPTSISCLNPTPSANSSRGPSFDAAAAAAGVTNSGSLQQQQQPGAVCPTGAAAPIFAGAGAAAVEAAVAAINAAIAGSTMQRKQQQQSSLSPDGTARSFYRALMETGGMLHPPGGPPIPLNVDFAGEIQPHLGRLLGRGGFGAVYEATWRGRKVRSVT
jgi:hypothetical protein